MVTTSNDVVLVDRLRVGSPNAQRFALDDFLGRRKREAWPDGLAMLNSLTSNDGKSVLIYSRWAGDKGVEDLRLNDPVKYKLYRSRAVNGPARPAGCVVIVSVEFNGPDEQRQKAWVDTVFEALSAEPVLPAGGISGTFHLSTDGRRVLNYAEWTSEAAHQEALDRSGQKAIGSGPKWLDVRNFPGVKSNDFERYTPYASLSQEMVHA